MQWSLPRRLLTVGSVLADIRIEVPHLPERGSDVLGSKAEVTAAGGFNILAAAARNGLAAAFAGQHGAGPYGTRIRADLAREGIAALLPPVSHGDSGFCLVMVEPDGERTFVTSPGVEAQIGTRRLADIALEPGDAVFVSGYDLSYPELGPAVARWAASFPQDLMFIADPGPLVGDIPSDVLGAVLRRASVLTMNRREARILSGADDVAGAWQAVRSRLSHDALLILRDGPAGCWLCGRMIGSAPVHVPAPKVDMIDSTGAGDAHTGVFVAAQGAGLDIVAAARRANAAAAVAVTRRGSATAPTAAELDLFLAQTLENGGRTAHARTTFETPIRPETAS
jgi:ribokinase